VPAIVQYFSSVSRTQPLFAAEPMHPWRASEPFHRGGKVMRLAFLVLAVLVVGCVPLPHRYQHTPHVVGFVTDGGTPSVDTRVRVAFNSLRDEDKRDACADPEDEATTTRKGKFTITGERRVRLYVWVIPSHSFESWQFCFEREGREPIRWESPRNYRYGPRYGPALMIMECDLARSSEVCHIRHEEYGKWG
jgi:hypothetical protein